MLDYETEYRKIEKDIFGGRRKIFSPIGVDLIFVKKITLPNFRAKEFYTLKTRKLRLFLPAIHSKNASK